MVIDIRRPQAFSVTDLEDAASLPDDLMSGFDKPQIGARKPD
jgi:hypothetical protein